MSMKNLLLHGVSVVVAFIGLMGVGNAADMSSLFDPENFIPFQDQVRSGTIDELRSAADNGDADAQYALGLHFLNRESLDRSGRKAAELFRKAADSGHVAAKFKLAECYQNEDGVFLDYGMVAKLAGEAAAAGYPPALGLLGDCYYSDTGVESDAALDPKEARKKNVLKGLELYREAARNGYAPAVSGMARYYSYEIPGIGKDEELSIQLHHFAAEHGALESQHFLDRYYSDGRLVPQDEAEALKWRAKMAEQGDLRALYDIARADITAREDQEKSELTAGFHTFLADANAGDAEAQIKAGDCYRKGYGVDADLRMALDLYLEAAASGLPEAMEKAGDVYSSLYKPGGGVSELFSEEKAAEWYRRADAAGHLPATIKLALLYSADPMNKDKFGPMIMKAAEVGNPRAQSILSMMYRRGEGVERNGTLGNVWFIKALRNKYAELDDYSFVSPDLEIPHNRMMTRFGPDKARIDAMGYLAFVHYRGIVVDQDAEIASQWCRKAADLGDVNSQTMLGTMLLEGDGIPRNVEEGASLLRKAADQGNALAQLQFGIYSLGETYGNQPDCAMALDYLTRAAEQNLEKAQFALANVLQNDIGCEKDFAQAEKWMTRAAERNLPQAIFALGKMYADECGVKADFPKAKELFEKAFFRYAFADAGVGLGKLYFYGRGMPHPNLIEAKTFFETAGERGSRDGWIMYAYATLTGDPNLIGEGPEALEMLTKTAAAGYPLAQYMLAMYLDGKEKHAEAAEWMTKAAEKGEVDAMHYLGGIMYARGQGVEKDARKAVYWLRKAAEKGKMSSQVLLAGYLLTGKDGVEVNREEGLKWAREGAGQGNASAMRMLEKYADESF